MSFDSSGWRFNTRVQTAFCYSAIDSADTSIRFVTVCHKTVCHAY